MSQPTLPIPILQATNCLQLMRQSTSLSENSRSIPVSAWKKIIRYWRVLTEVVISFSIDNDYIDFFPSANLTYSLSEKTLLRFAYGRTINRPEFREISLQAYYDFEEKATIYGDTSLVNAYIQNLDFRFEWFPAPGDMITVGGFYKRFQNPIEAHLKEAGSGRNYTFGNAEMAKSYGVGD